MIIGMRYRSTNATLYPATYHRIRCPRHRRQVLAGSVQQRLKERIGEVAARGTLR
jgi:REP element-mobilizing transposase RayT